MDKLVVFTRGELIRLCLNEKVFGQDNIAYVSEELYKELIGNSNATVHDTLEEAVKKLAVSRVYLENWYQDSVIATDEPVWSDKHLNELYDDFYLIPKNENKEKTERVQQNNKRICEDIRTSMNYLGSVSRLFSFKDKKNRPHYETALMIMERYLKELEE